MRYNESSVPDVMINVSLVSVVGEQTRLGLLRFKVCLLTKE